MTLLFVVVMGIVEGLTEFLPISSTGHLILTAHAFGLHDDDKVKTFEIFIQFGAILAVIWEYRNDLIKLTLRLRNDPAARVFVGKLLVAFLPAAIIGVKIRETMHEHLMYATPVALALIVGGILMFIIEQFMPKREPQEVESVTWLQALGIGLFQCLSLWPGFSRSAATIMGGMVLGLDRSRATVFSFYLAIPTLCGATVYETYKSRDKLSTDDIGWFALGTFVSFVVALVVIKGMLAYVRRYSFRPLAVYRILLGIVVLAVRPETTAKESPANALAQPQVQAAALARRES